MSEADLWKEIKDNVGHRGHFSRVESGATSAGIPDVDFCIDGVEGHIELKFTYNTIKKNFVRPTQVKWFRDRVKAGGRPWLLALIIVGRTKHYCLCNAKDMLYVSESNITDFWLRHATYMWSNKMDWNELISHLSQIR